MAAAATRAAFAYQGDPPQSFVAPRAARVVTPPMAAPAAAPSDGVVTQLGTDQAPSDRAEAGHGERVTQHPGESLGLKGSAHGPGGTLADAPGSSPGCGSQDVAALPRERSDAGGHGGRGPALNNRKSKPFRSRIILSSGTGARKAECPAKNCGAGHDGECCWSKSGQMVFRISWLGCSPESALGPYREARCTHSAGCTSVQCPSSHGADFVVLPSEDGAHRYASRQQTEHLQRPRQTRQLASSLPSVCS